MDRVRSDQERSIWNQVDDTPETPELSSQLDELRREIAIGIEEADRGELAAFDPLATLERIRARLGATAKHP